MQAICVDEVKDIAAHLGDLKSGNLCVFTPQKTADSHAHHAGELLLNKVKSPWPIDSLVAGIYVADSLDDALSCVKH